MPQSVEDASKLYREALDASRDQRRQVEEDLAFTDPADPQQWDGDTKSKRENDPGGIRPCLVFDQIGQYISNVVGNIEQQPPSMHALPVDSGADKKVAEQLDGLFRYIEYSSRAQQQYMLAEWAAARAGVGYLTVRPTYVNRALNWQEPRIGCQADPLSVVFDPWSVSLDGSDGTFGFVKNPYSYREFERRWPKHDKVSFGTDDRARVKDERESIMVAEGWWLDEQTANMIVCEDVNGEPGTKTALREDDYWAACQAVGRTLQVYGTYKDKIRSVKWGMMSGADYLQDLTEYPAESIGIVPVYGYVSFKNDRLNYCGMGRRGRHPQQAYNYHRSEMQAYMGQAPKSPWITPVRAIAGLEALWDRSAVDSRAFLPYNDVDEVGAPINAPQRMPVAMNLANHAAEAEIAKQDIQAALGMYQANLGAPSNETSGVAIESRKQQGESSTALFPSHLNASVQQVGRLCMQMLPKLIDEKRQIRILGIDMTPGAVTIDPKAPQAVQEGPQGLVINPNVGKYDVRVVAGASFATQRTQAQAALSEMMRGNPNLTPVIAPLWAQTLDVPHADKLAQVLTAVAPPEVKAILQPQGQNDGPTTAELTAKVEQLQQALQQAIQTAHEAEQELEECHQKLEDKDAENESRELELSIKAYDSATKRLQVTGANEEQIQAVVMQLLQQMAAQPSPMAEENEPQEAEPQPESADMQAMPADLGEMPEPEPAQGMEY